MERTIEALKLLACGADVQIAALPAFVVVADEIALIFDDELRALDVDACGPPIRVQLAAIEGRLSAMSDTKSLWTIDALRTASAWAEVRGAAAQILRMLGVGVAAPDLSWVTLSKWGDR